MSFKHIKPGDQVYVVWQSKKQAQGEGYYMSVAKVGRKYGYIERHGRQEPFDLLTGESVHNYCSNSRANGWGFDVWHSKEAHDAHIATIEASTRLATRLSGLRRNQYSSTLENASAELVADLHAVLDRHGVSL